MQRSDDAKITMYEHSKAKVELYGKYLSIYLNVLERASFVNKIYLYDLFAGEGEYMNEEFGSPIATMNCIKNHYFFNNKSCKNIKVMMNDYGYSEIEPQKLKIDRIKEITDNIFKPRNVELTFSNEEYNKLLPRIICELDELKEDERALLFIDPWGYKDIRPQELKGIFKTSKVEIILFLPISFMYRFSEKALFDDFPAGKSLEMFLSELFQKNVPNTSNAMEFILDIREKFKDYLGSRYVATITIQRDRANIFCLYFFSHSKIGFQKMIEAKWVVDKERGKGFKLIQNLSLFKEIEVDDYLSKVKEFIFNSNGKTNHEMLDFGYENEFLPKHTNEVLNILLSKELIIRLDLDRKNVKGFYLTNKDRNVLIKKKE
jgi:three-Cys-motif partner protein